jgi:hypothetical protein
MTTSAKEIMAAAEETVTIPNKGWTVKIRAVSNMELVMAGAMGLITSGSRAAAKKKPEELTDDEKTNLAQDEYRAARLTVLLGMVEPRAVERSWDEIDRDEEIHIDLLGEDMIYLSMRIMKLSGMISEVPDLPFFRGSVATDSGPNGNEVSGAPVGTAETPAPGIQSQPPVLPPGRGTGPKRRRRAART